MLRSTKKSHSLRKSEWLHHAFDHVLDNVVWRLALFFLLTLIASSLALWSNSLDGRAVSAINAWALDRYFAFRGPLGLPNQETTSINKILASRAVQPSDIVLVECSHALPRPLIARLLRQLREARVVAFDMMFVDYEGQLAADDLEPEEKQEWYGEELRSWRRENALLTAEIKRHSKVVLGTWPEEKRDAEAEAGGVQTNRSGTIRTFSQGQPEADGFMEWRRPPLSMWNSAAYHAHLLVQLNQQDQIARTVKLRDGDPSAPEPAFGLAITAAALKIPYEQLRREVRAMSPQGGVLRLGNHRIPYDADGSMTIDYLGGRKTFEVENRIVYNRALQYFPEDFKNKIVIVGEASNTSKEIMQTPFGLMPGMQIHANIVATLLSANGPPQPMSLFLMGGIAFLACLLVLVPLWRLPLWTSFVLLLIWGLAFIQFGGWIFSTYHQILPLSVPLLAMLLMWIGLVLFEYARARWTLGAFIGSDMVPKTLGLLSQLQLGGRTEEATAWMCDLRGYSTISEGRDPGEVSRFLAPYTERVTQLVHLHQGRAIDYQGDGVFAVFEKKRGLEHDAIRAVRAALIVREELELLHQQRLRDEMPTAKCSIGIATGPMMIGLVGSRLNLKRGAVGDTVNVASRLQGLSTKCGQNVLITDYTHEIIKNDFVTVYCNEHKVHNRNQPIKTYGVLSEKGEMTNVSSSINGRKETALA